MPRMHHRREYVICGKPRCHCAAPGDRGHGPYWYGYWWEDGTLRKRYIGKTLPAGERGETAAEVQAERERQERAEREREARAEEVRRREEARRVTEQQQRAAREREARRAREEAERSAREARERAERARRYTPPPRRDRAWWDILGVSPGASWDTIRAAYRREAMRAHPDRGSSTADMQNVNAAFEAAKRAHGRA